MMKKDKIFASDSFYTKSGRLDIGSTEPLSVAFIGGSLTEGEIDYEGTSLSDGRLKWANVVLKFLGGLFPLRPLTAVNAGLGGTESEYGAIRFQRDVLSHSPDIVFIEFSCNDRPVRESECIGKEALKRQVYLENMIRQCMEAEKVPIIIYQHVPQPFEGEMMDYYLRGCELKNEVLRHYEITPIDSAQAVKEEYLALKEADPSLTFRDFLATHYNDNGSGGFDVHPRASGYMLFALSVVNAISRHPERYLKAFRMQSEPYCKGSEAMICERYNYIPAASDRIKYKGDWRLYTAKNMFESDDPELLIKPPKYTQGHQFPDGIMQTLDPEEAEFSFETEAGRICMPHVSARAGLAAAVYADGVKVGEISCQSRWHGMNYLGSWVELPKGRKTVVFKIDKATPEARVFRFGYIVEAK